MKANELRIGNLINIDDCLTEITGITKSTVFFNDGFQMFIAGGIEPIPLTEEWLFKFGFDVNNRPKWLNHLSKYRFVCGTTRYLKGCENDSKPIEFVHQLQNLYFALIGEELLPIGDRLT